MIDYINIVLYAAYTVSSVTGLALIKANISSAILAYREGRIVFFDLLPIGFGIILYVTSFLIWIAILSRTQLSTAYPVAIGLTLIFSTFVAAILLNEPLGIVKIAGITAVIAGIVIIFQG